MVSELLRHSNRADVCERIPEHLRLCHRPQEVTRDDAPVVAHSKARQQQQRQQKRQKQPMQPAMRDLFGTDNEWALGPLNPVATEGEEGVEQGEEMEDEEEEEDGLLDLAGF